MTPKRSECGCTVDYDVSWGSAEPQRGNFQIKFCPLHAVAEEMLDALVVLQNFVDSRKYTEIDNQLRELLSRAQKGVR